MLRIVGYRSGLLTIESALVARMKLDTEKIDQAVLALLTLGKHEGRRAWKSFDREVMGRLQASPQAP
jgi:hypothetical protein